MKINKTIIVIIVLILAAILILKRCNKISNESIDNNIGLVDQKTEQVIINDSLHGISQDVLITTDKSLIARLTDSLQSELLKQQGIKNPTVLIKWKDNFIENNSTGKLKDSLSSIIDDLLAKSKDTSITKADFENYVKSIKNKKTPFEISTKYRYEKGSIDYYGNIKSDSLSITSEPTISVGESRKNIFSRPTLKVVVGNKNPLIKSDSLQSILYIKSPNRTQLSLGPQVLIGNKGNYAVGAGVTLKKGIFSLSLGYLLINKNK